jgi:hypothetical protein
MRRLSYGLVLGLVALNNLLVQGGKYSCLCGMSPNGADTALGRRGREVRRGPG